mgnify:FL=1
MEALKIIISGMIDGLTGFLPVSSSGHLLMLKNVFGFGEGDSILFDLFLKLATIAVIVFVFRKDILRMIKLESDIYRRLALLILTATVSTGIVGLGCRSFAGYAAGTVFFPGIFMIITGVMLFITDGIKKGEVKISDAGFFEAVVIGGVQGLSALPGLSRCGMVITVCLLFGFDRKLTWRFSFLCAIPSLLGAVILDIIDLARFGAADVANTGWYILASVFAMLTGYIGLVILNQILKRRRFRILSVYCLALGGFMLASMIVM